MARVHGNHCRVFLNGVEVSRMVRSVNVRAEVDEVVTSVITLVEAPRVVQTEGGHLEFRFGTEPSGPVSTVQQGPLVVGDQALRAILVRAEDE